jgi:hypothetical protein
MGCPERSVRNYRRFGTTYLYYNFQEYSDLNPLKWENPSVPFKEFSDLDSLKWDRWVVPKRQYSLTDVLGQPICNIFKSSVTLTLEDGPDGCSRNVDKKLQTFRDNLFVPF